MGKPSRTPRRPRCPTCHVILSNGPGGRVYCSVCGWHQRRAVVDDETTPWTPMTELAPQDYPGGFHGCWVNDRYQVLVRRVPPVVVWEAPVEGYCYQLPTVVHLSIKRLDQTTLRDWRHLQRIKNEVVGPDCQGFEVFPPERYLVDNANQWHLWVFADPGFALPIGFAERLVIDDEEVSERWGAVQRPFDPTLRWPSSDDRSRPPVRAPSAPSSTT